MSDLVGEPEYHVLLVGIDAYPPGYNGLEGCVADIDAIEALLLDPPGISLPADRIRITRLAAPRPHHPSSSRFQAQTKAPTKDNLVAELKALAGPAVKPDDRVLIYYSGHGDEVLWKKPNPVWHESLVPHDGQNLEGLFDVELNALINSIAARTPDLTVVLDCCHSAGATRDLADANPLGATRSLSGNAVLALPDLEAQGLSGGPARMLQSVDPRYVAVVACQSNEKAGEGQWPGEPRALGILTYALLGLLSGCDAAQRAELRWADLWPQLLDAVAARCQRLRRRTQHPLLIGRSERRVFGGPWQPGDAGYRLAGLPDGRYRIAAGALMGLTAGAEVAVYGDKPAYFPTIGSPEDQPVGRLCVVAAERAECVAESIGDPFPLQGARGRLVKPGKGERLRVALKPADPVLAGQLCASPLLTIVPAGSSDADLEVIALLAGGWIIGNDVEPALAMVPPGETRALRAGLEEYARYHAALRLAHNCQDAELSGRLDVRLLDCGDAAQLKKMTAQQKADPPLPEVARDADGVYALASGSLVCIRLTNHSEYDLESAAVVNCGAGGVLELLGAGTLKKGASYVLWLRDEPGKAFWVAAGQLPAMPGEPEREFVTDRLVAIGTTRPGVDLAYLRVEQPLQAIVNANFTTKDPADLPKPKQVAAAPAELWTASVVPVRIRK